MTKRFKSKIKPYLQSGVDLWGKADSLWTNPNRKEYGPGQQKRSHQSSERAVKLPITKQIEYLIDSGFLMAPCAENDVKVSFGEPKYSSLLKEKQKLKRFYSNISEKQFRCLFQQAQKIRGEVGNNFISLLEKRLDTVLFRSNLASSFFQARQMINHGHVLVNGVVVESTGYLLEKGDVVQVAHSILKLVESQLVTLATNETFINNSHIELDVETFSCVLMHSPKLEEISFPFTIDLEKVVRYYR